jgi:hypothetical protein
MDWLDFGFNMFNYMFLVLNLQKKVVISEIRFRFRIRKNKIRNKKII